MSNEGRSITIILNVITGLSVKLVN